MTSPALGERLAASTLTAILIATAGIVTVVAGSLGRGGLLGDMLALLMTAAFAALIVMPKANPALRVTDHDYWLVHHRRLVPALCASGRARYSQCRVRERLRRHQSCPRLFLQGARLIPTATAGMIVSLEIVLSPFWVWLFKGEPITRRPSSAALSFSARLSAICFTRWVACRASGCMLHLGGDDPTRPKRFAAHCRQTAPTWLSLSQCPEGGPAPLPDYGAIWPREHPLRSVPRAEADLSGLHLEICLAWRGCAQVGPGPRQAVRLRSTVGWGHRDRTSGHLSVA